MTIVDSINKITESLGGDTSGVQTAAEAIDALGPVISGGGGGGSVGTATLIYDEITGLPTDVELNNLTSFDDYTAMGSPAIFVEPASIISDSEVSKYTQSGQHGFSFYEPSSGVFIIVEYVGYHATSVDLNSGEPTSFSLYVSDCAVYRVYEDGVWGDWIEVFS